MMMVLLTVTGGMTAMFVHWNPHAIDNGHIETQILSRNVDTLGLKPVNNGGGP